MTKIKDVTLAFHCPETLDEKFSCKKCSRSVVDFTNKTERELSDALKKSSGKVCGLFLKSQMSDQFLKYAGAAVLITSLVRPAIAQEPVKGDSLKSASEKVTTEEAVFLGTIVEIPAEPIGGAQKLMKEIAKKIIWPTGLKEKGKVFVEFSIDTLGKIENVRLLKGFNELADREALRVVSSINFPFNPGRQRGKAVRTTFAIPILFDPAKH